MGLEGLHRVLEFVTKKDLKVGTLVTDRHQQINKWMREEHSEVKHYFDVWHVAKGECTCVTILLLFTSEVNEFVVCSTGFRKKVRALAKQKDCDLIGKWEQSMINHLYWCVVSTQDGDENLMQAKWLSLENHIHNKHSGHGQLFSKCSHGRLLG